MLSYFKVLLLFVVCLGIVQARDKFIYKINPDGTREKAFVYSEEKVHALEHPKKERRSLGGTRREETIEIYIYEPEPDALCEEDAWCIHNVKEGMKKAYQREQFLKRQIELDRLATEEAKESMRQTEKDIGYKNWFWNLTMP